jgi:hypothetical protein
MTTAGNLTPYLPPVSSTPQTTAQNTIPAFDPATAESAAQQIGSASYTSYGVLPNPQAVYEAAQTGATATLTQLALMGTPEYAAELTGSPAGGQIAQQPFSPTTAQTPAQATGNTGVYGPAPSAKQEQQSIQQSGNSQWAPLGSVPSTNLAWMNSIEDSKNPATIKQWQTMLSANGGGFYGANSGNHVTGAWNSSTDTAALQGFLIARFMPDALYSSDTTTAANASQFLSALGVDTTSMQQNMRDPTMQASVAQQWMMAQGPNQNASTNQLQTYADKYGYSALPTSYQAIVRPDPLRSIRDGLLNLPIVGLLNDVPLASGAFHGVVNLLTGNLDFAHLMDDPRQIEAQTVKTEMKSLNNLSQTDIENMQPLLNQVADDSGFMGFMDSWDHDRNSFILEIGSTLVNGFTKGKWQNPFDPTSSANMWAQAHADDMAGVLFGDQWAQNNPVLAGMANFIINTADDPTSYIGLLGKLPMISMAQNVGTASKILDDTTGPALGLRSLFGTLKDPETRAAWGDLAGNSMKEKVSDGWMKTARTAVKSGKLSTIDAAQGFQIPMFGSEAAGKYALVQKILTAPDDATARDLMMNGDGETMGFGHMMLSGRAVYNTHANWAAVAKAASSGKLNHARAIGALSESMDDALITDPVQTLSNFRNRALVSGMTPAQYGPLSEKLADAIMGKSGDVEGGLAAAKEYESAILKAQEDNFGVTKQMLDKVRGYRYKSRMANPAMADEKNVYAPDPTAASSAEAKEVSTATRASGDERINAAQSIQDVQHAITTLQGVAKPDDPHLADLQNQLTQLQRPVPMLTTQLADLYQFPYTPYEMLVARNPIMRTLEKTQAAVRADAINSVWKRWAIGRVSSAFRIVLGDDTIRPVTLLVSQGHPLAAMSLLGKSIMRSVGLLVPGARKLTMAKVEEILDKNPEARTLMQHYGQLVNETLPHAFQAFHPTDVGYAQALHHVMSNLLAPDPLVQTWLKGYESGGLEGARQSLEDLVKSATGEDKYTPVTNAPTLPEMSRKSDPRDFLTHKQQLGEGAKPTTAQLKQMRDEMNRFHGETERAKIKSWLNVQNGDLSEENLQAVLNRWHSYASGLFRDEDIRKWTQAGGTDLKRVSRKVKNEANLNASNLPVISSRVMNSYAQQMLNGGITKFPQLIFNEITKPAVDSARANGFMSVKDLYERSIRNYYDKTSYAARADYAQMVDKESTSQAVDWMLNNTYQGGRSIVGGALRNVTPFYGATANLDRFVWRQAMAHPAIGVAAVRAMNASEESQVNQTAPAFTGGNGFMAMLGFGGGEGLQFNPLNAFFLTADGLGSVIPGTGPVFTPLWQGLSQVSPGLTQLLSTIPGISQEIDWSTGNAAPMFPWLSDLLQGAAMGATGTGNVLTNTLENLPGIGLGSQRVNQLISEKVQQEDRDKGGSGPGGTVDQADQQGIARQVGYDLLGQGAAQFAVPVSPEVEDTTGQNIESDMQTYRSATTDAEKDDAITQGLGVTNKVWQAALNQDPGAPSIASLVAKNPDSAGALMVYEDSRVSSDERDAIQAAAPWVVSSATGKYQYNTTQTVGDLSQWDLMRNMGDISVLSPFGDANSFLSKVTDERQVNNAWLQYDQLKNLEYSQMAANGWSTSSPNYIAWNDAVMQPALVQMETEFPAWGNKFGAGGGGTSASDLAQTTAPLRTLQTWEAIPQNPDFETQTSVMWRNALQARDQAASMIYQLNQTGGSPTETQMVMTQLQSTLQQLAAQDPTFASELSAYSFGKWQDVVQLESDEQLGNFYAQTSVTQPSA